MFKITKGKLFIRNKQKWLNVPLLSQTHGDGLKGYLRFFKGLIQCKFGKHTYIGTWFIRYDEESMRHRTGTKISCGYCGEVKNDGKNHKL